jgi:putative pyruvate formate lyase activating enzyme
VGPDRLAHMMLELQESGCHNINWVTPEHVIPQILEAMPRAVAGGLCLTTVYNTSSYDSIDSLELMDGIVDVYMPDLKYATPARSDFGGWTLGASEPPTYWTLAPEV